MIRNRSAAFVFGAALALAAGAFAQQGGFPSRPTFQQATARSLGNNFIAKSTASGVASVAYVSYRDSADRIVGYVGDASASDDAIYVASNVANANVHLFTSGTGRIVVASPGGMTLNGTSVPRTSYGSCNAGGLLNSGIASSNLNTCTRNSAGSYTLPFTSSYALAPACVVTPTGSAIVMIVSVTTSSVTVGTGAISTGAAVDQAFHIACNG